MNTSVHLQQTNHTCNQLFRCHHYLHLIKEICQYIKCLLQ